MSFADVCEAHRAEWLAWADYRLATPLLIHSVGPVDREARFQDWRNTIARQRGLIESACREHAAAAVDVA